MREDFLHYLWRYKKFDFTRAQTTGGEVIELIDTGSHNLQAGPDFFNARLRIGGQLWAGNVEIHIRSSDWYFHQHEIDPAYDNVILHVVWEEDIEVYRKDNSPIPSLELKNLSSPKILKKYKNLLSQKPEFISCEKDFSSFDDFRIKHWLERLYLERLERKTGAILNDLEQSGNNWEAVLFKSLARNFGLQVNADAFESIAGSFDFKIFQKALQHPARAEALLMGQARLLETKLEDYWLKTLRQEYDFLKLKFKLNNRQVIPVKFFRLRPDNFPTIRLSQLVSVYVKNPRLFQRLMDAASSGELYQVFEVEVSAYWQKHYNFSKKHKFRRKKLSRNFVDLLIINTVIPLRFCYSKYIGREEEEKLLDFISAITSEKNSQIRHFNALRPGTAKNALESQGLLEMKQFYCEKHLCLECELGVHLLQQNV
jgi:hypothetical protein